MKRDSVWESRLDHVLQRFVGNNLLSDVVSFNNQRAQRPENTWEDTSQYIESFYHSIAQQSETIQDKMPKPKFGLEPWVVDLKSKLTQFVYIRGHVTLQVQSNAKGVNSSLQLWLFHFSTNKENFVFYQKQIMYFSKKDIAVGDVMWSAWALSMTNYKHV